MYYAEIEGGARTDRRPLALPEPYPLQATQRLPMRLRPLESALSSLVKRRQVRRKR